MRYMKHLCLLIVMTPLALMAADPVGRITSSGPLTLDGKAVPATAASSLPLVAGDEIATSTTAATIFFSDGSRGTIVPNSRVKLEPNGSSVALRVLSGSVDFKRANGSQIRLIASTVPTGPKSAVALSSDGAASDTDCKPQPRSKKCPPCKESDKDCCKDCDTH